MLDHYHRVNGVAYHGPIAETVREMDEAEATLVVASAARRGYVVPIAGDGDQARVDAFAKEESRAARAVLAQGSRALKEHAAKLRDPATWRNFVYGLPPHWFD